MARGSDIFAGWRDNHAEPAFAGIKQSGETFTMPARDVELTAAWYALVVKDSAEDVVSAITSGVSSGSVQLHVESYIDTGIGYTPAAFTVQKFGGSFFDVQQEGDVVNVMFEANPDGPPQEGTVRITQTASGRSAVIAVRQESTFTGVSLNGAMIRINTVPLRGPYHLDPDRFTLSWKVSDSFGVYDRKEWKFMEFADDSGGNVAPGYYHILGARTYSNANVALGSEYSEGVAVSASPFNIPVSSGENVIKVRFGITSDNYSNSSYNVYMWVSPPAISLSAGSGNTISSVSYQIHSFNDIEYTITVQASAGGYLALSGNFGLKINAFGHADAGEDIYW
jgi:hypothetical protein